MLDVDGPLNPYAAPHDRRPEGFLTYRHADRGGWYTDQELRHVLRPWELGKIHRVWLHPGHGEMITGLAAETGLEVVWCTAWMYEANSCIAPAVGLPPLPVVEFDHPELIAPFTWATPGAWKWPAVARYAAGRPLVRLDDEHDDPDWAEGRAEFERARGDASTLLCTVDPRTGLLPQHVDTVREWAKALDAVN